MKYKVTASIVVDIAEENPTSTLKWDAEQFYDDMDMRLSNQFDDYNVDYDSLETKVEAI